MKSESLFLTDNYDHLEFKEYFTRSKFFEQRPKLEYFYYWYLHKIFYILFSFLSIIMSLVILTL